MVMRQLKNSQGNHTGRWTFQEEKETALRIRECERVARAALSGWQVADNILRRRSKRAEKTKAAAVDRLQEALEACRQASSTTADDAFKCDVRQAQAAMEEAEELRWSLAMSAKRIVHVEARKFANSMMNEDDLVQEGYIGLLRAAKRFDPDRGVRFGSYAAWWARAKIVRAIDTNSRVIRIPDHGAELIRNLKKVIRKFEREGRAYTNAMLAEELGISEDRVVFIRIQAGTVVCSMDDIDLSGRTYAERLRWEARFSSPDAYAVVLQAVERMSAHMLKHLSERQRAVLTMRYGLNDTPAMTLAEVGKAMSLSRERIRQIEEEAIDCLRQHMPM